MLLVATISYSCFSQNEWICLMSEHTAEKCLKTMQYVIDGTNDLNHQLQHLTSSLLNSANDEQRQSLSGLRELTSSLSSVGGGNGNDHTFWTQCH